MGVVGEAAAAAGEGEGGGNGDGGPWGGCNGGGSGGEGAGIVTSVMTLLCPPMCSVADRVVEKLEEAHTPILTLLPSPTRCGGTTHSSFTNRAVQFETSSALSLDVIKTSTPG